MLVLFFVLGVVKTCGSFAEMKKPEVAFKCFIRFVLAQAAVSWGMELMTGAFRVAQGMVTTIMDSSGLTAMSATTLPDELVSVIEDVGFIDSIPLWAVTLLGSLFIWVLSLVMIPGESILRAVPAAVAVRTAGGRRGSGRIFRPAPCAGKWGDRLGLRACSLSLCPGRLFSV